MSVAKTRVGWPEEPHLRGMLEVRFRRIDDGNFYCFACWLIYHAARARLRRDTAHVQPARNLQGVAYMHPEVRSMSEALGLSLRHSDDDLSCIGPTRAWNINKSSLHTNHHANSACAWP